MKKILFSLSLMIFGSIAMNAQSVSVNTDGSTADASSILDVKSTTKGMLVPRMTTAQRTAIPTPANGLLVYDTDVKSFWYYNGTAWTNITPASGGIGNFSLPIDSTGNFTSAVIKIKDQNPNNLYSLIQSETVNSNAIFGITSGSTSSGVLGRNHSASVNGAGVMGYSDVGMGVRGVTNRGIGVYGYSDYDGIGGVFGNSPDSGYGVRGRSQFGTGVLASSEKGSAVETYAYGTNPSINAYAIAADAIYAMTEGASKAAIKGEANYTGGMGVYGISTSSSGYGVRGFSGLGTGVHASTNTGHGIIASANTGVGIRTSSTSGNALEVFGKLKIYGNAVNPQVGSVLTSDAEGNATWKLNRVAFRATGSGSIPQYGSTAIMTGEEYDYTNSFNFTTGFTVPVTGVYSLGGQAKFSLLNDINDNIIQASITIRITRGSNTIVITSPDAAIFNFEDHSIASVLLTTDIRLLAGDIVKLYAFQDNSAEVSIGWNGSFFGHLVFAE